MPVPFLGRLNIIEYVAVLGSFVFVVLEAFLRVATLALPGPLINLFYRASRRLFNRWQAPAEKRAEEKKKEISTAIRNASDFVELCALYGYVAEEHVVQTKDGYLLGLHRLAWKRDDEPTRVNAGPDSVQKRVVYLHHGLLMNSEVWVCLTDAQRVLPFVLVERGFDVWLGNNRGNKYSKKSVHSAPTSLEFWNFSIDQFAFHDIPDSIEYILGHTGQPSLSYIGFSQGTAQAFAALSIHPKLNKQVNVFIALAPAMSPPGLANGIADALIKASPQVLFLLFGRRGILSSAPLWESIIYPPLYIKIIDMGIRFLFNWRAANITVAQKLAAYPHLYSFTSTKSVVHWFQIIRTKSFQMYDDDPPLSLGNAARFTKVAKYPTRNITTPIVLVYGGSDSLVDIRAMLRELPATTVATEIPHYEHLDFLWARDVAAQVFPHVFDALDHFTHAGHSRDEYVAYRRARTQSLSRSASFWRQQQQQLHQHQSQYQLHHHHRLALREGSDANDSDVNSALGDSSSNNNAVAAAAPHQAVEGIVGRPSSSRRGVQFHNNSDDDDAASASTVTDLDSPHPIFSSSSSSAAAARRPRDTDSSRSVSGGVPERAVLDTDINTNTTTADSPSSSSSPPSLLKARSSNGSLRSAMRSRGPSAKGIMLGASKPVVGGVVSAGTDASAASASGVGGIE